jgi:glc operon protein GlcG
MVMVDDGGHVLSLQRLDKSELASSEVAIQKALTAVTCTRPSKALAEALVTHNRTPVLKLPGTLPIEGGLPIIVNEKVIGAIGVSGMTSQQDGQMAKAGGDALPKILGQ